jgi:sulfur-oxidizing protein SoxY
MMAMTVVSTLQHKGWEWNSCLKLTLFLVCCQFAAGPLWATESEDRWLQIKNSLFGEKYVQRGEDLIALETPTRAMDAAIVPITIRSKLSQTPQRYIRSLYLVIDNNPSPVAAVFHFPGKHGWESLSTRIRINAYTDLRVIAELNDGKLYMVNNYVKASGGCSAPSLKDPKAAASQLGKIKLRLPETYEANALVPAQLLIKHPNSSGLQFDQISRFYIPANFIRNITVTYNGEEVFSAETDISISEDPSIRFGFVPEKAGLLEVHVKDSNGRTFTHSVDLPVQAKAE